MKIEQMRRVVDEDVETAEIGRGGNNMSSASMPPSIASSPDLIQRLRAGTGVQETPEQLDEQKVSFIYGNLPVGSLITREQVAAQIIRSKLAA